jgi:hypothetical protein
VKKIRAAGTVRRKPRPKAPKRNPGTGFVSKRPGAIERIIAATRKEPDDRDQLARDLDEADLAYGERVFQREVQRKETFERQRRALKFLRKAYKLIEPNGFLRANAGAELARVIENLRDLDKWDNWRQTRQRAKRARAERGESDRQPTPADRLAAELLPVFEARFDAPANWSSRNGEPDGAVIDFIEATLKEMDLPYHRATITKALGKKRKK